MLSLGQRMSREKLAKAFSKTTVIDSFGMTWCAWALQNGHPEIAGRYISYPPEAVNGDAGAPLGIYPWQLETLVNEALVAPAVRNPRQRQLVTSQFKTVYALAKFIQRIEEADDRRFLDAHDVFYEVHRIGHRQFEWQRGFANMPRFYRAIHLFGGGAAGAYFESRIGCSVSAFMEAGFHLFCGADSSPMRRWSDRDGHGGVDPALRERVIAHLSVDASEARAIASRLRCEGEHIGYKPSLLRQYPLVRFGADGGDLMAPLPPLILQRITSGLYLDVVGGGGAVWGDLGRRFEDYACRYLAAMLDGSEVAGESSYGRKGSGFRTPDVLVSQAGTVALAVECKAKRMPIDARYSGDPVAAARDAYEEIAKGVFQLWRFFSHARRGLFGAPVAADCLGVVLTAEPWLVMGHKLHPEVIAMAHRLADEKDPDITAGDRRRVPIVLVDDLEYALQNATAGNVMAALARLAADESGWHYSLAHGVEIDADRAYPFAAELAGLLPWWQPRGEDGGDSQARRPSRRTASARSGG